MEDLCAGFVERWKRMMNSNPQEIETSSKELLSLYTDLKSFYPILMIAANPPSEAIQSHAVVGFYFMQSHITDPYPSDLTEYIESKSISVLQSGITGPTRKIFVESIIEYAVSKKREQFLSNLCSIADEQLTTSIPHGLYLWACLCSDKNIFVHSSSSVLSKVCPIAFQSISSSDTQQRETAFDVLNSIVPMLGDVEVPDSFVGGLRAAISSALQLILSNTLSGNEISYFLRLVELMLRYLPGDADIFPENIFTSLSEFTVSESNDELSRIAVDSIFPTVLKFAPFLISDSLAEIIQNSVDLSLSLCTADPEDTAARSCQDMFSELSGQSEEDAFSLINEVVSQLLSASEPRNFQIAFYILESVLESSAEDIAAEFDELEPAFVASLDSGDSALIGSACDFIGKFSETVPDISTRLLRLIEPKICGLCWSDPALKCLIELLDDSNEEPSESLKLLQSLANEFDGKVEHIETAIDAVSTLVKTIDGVNTQVFESMKDILLGFLQNSPTLRGPSIVCFGAFAWSNPKLVQPILGDLLRAILESIEANDENLTLNCLSTISNLMELYPVSMSQSIPGIFECVKGLFETENERLLSEAIECLGQMFYTFTGEIAEVPSQLFEDIFKFEEGTEESAYGSAKYIICGCLKAGVDTTKYAHLMLDQAMAEKNPDYLKTLWESLAFCCYHGGKAFMSICGSSLMKLISDIFTAKPSAYAQSAGRQTTIHRSLITPILHTIEQIAFALGQDMAQYIDSILPHLTNLARGKNQNTASSAIRTLSIISFFLPQMDNIFNFTAEAALRMLSTSRSLNHDQVFGAFPFLIETNPEFFKDIGSIRRSISEYCRKSEANPESISDAAILWGTLCAILNYSPSEDEISEMTSMINPELNDFSLRFLGIIGSFAYHNWHNCPKDFVQASAVVALASEDPALGFVLPEDKKLFVEVAKSLKDEERGKKLRWNEGDIQRMEARLASPQ